jgi:tetratricopeptide (TPR) repeat protein
MQDIIRNDAISKDSFINVLIEECDKLIEENPTSIFPYITKGDLYASTSRFKQARETYEKVLDIAPLNAMVRSKLESLDHKNSP